MDELNTFDPLSCSVLKDSLSWLRVQETKKVICPFWLYIMAFGV